MTKYSGNQIGTAQTMVSISVNMSIQAAYCSGEECRPGCRVATSGSRGSSAGEARSAVRCPSVDLTLMIVAGTMTAPIERVKLLIQNQNEMLKTGWLSQPY